MQGSGPRLAPLGPSRSNAARAGDELGSIFARDCHRSGSITRRLRAFGCHRLLEISREAHLSAAPQEPSQDSWFPRPHEDGERPQGHQQSPPQGSPTPGRQRLQEVSETALAPRTSSRADQPQPRLHFSAPDRLRKRFEFRRVRNQGRRVHTKSFVLQVASSAKEQARLGLTVSRQVGGAVRRNRLKRLVREAFRLRRDLFPSGCDIVVIAKTGAVAQGLSDVLGELERAGSALRAVGGRPPRGDRSGAPP